jgi:hypothetical protein
MSVKRTGWMRKGFYSSFLLLPGPNRNLGMCGTTPANAIIALCDGDIGEEVVEF